MEEQPKLRRNGYAEHSTGQNFVMKSRGTSKTVTHAKGQYQAVTYPTVTYKRWKYWINQGNL